MPFYTFKCPSCNREEEILQSMKAPKPVCKRCINASCGTHTPEMERKRCYNNRCYTKI